MFFAKMKRCGTGVFSDVSSIFAKSRVPCLRDTLVFCCRTHSASTVPRTSRVTCCPYAYALITLLRVSRNCLISPPWTHSTCAKSQTEG